MLFRSDRDPVKHGIQDTPVWLALALYLKQLPDRDSDGLGDLPPEYFIPENRVKIRATWNPVSLFAHAHPITWAGLAINIMLFSLFALFVFVIIRRIREMR